MSYRADIDGLRAVAIISVVLYHFGFPLTGGYVGVDVFFVISGYLITRIIAKGIRGGTFSRTQFYERRARRILPALFGMLLVVTAVCAVLLTPEGFKSYGQSLFAADLSASNVYFALQTGYFTDAKYLVPLLHTWSLGVEEQFYLAFPLYLFFGVKVLRASLWVLVVPVIVVSIGLSVWLTLTAPSYAFYLPFSRVWELAVGGALAVGAVPLVRSRWMAESTAVAGSAMLIAAILTFDDATAFPGVAALLPVLGTALLIHAGSSANTVVGRLLSLRLMVFVGLISYSWYLWHWPLIVLSGIIAGRPLSLPETAALLILSLVMATLSWRYVERPFRQVKPQRSGRRVLAVATAGVVAFAAVGLLAAATRGLPQRLPADALAFGRGAADVNPLRARCDSRTPQQILGGDLCVIGAAGAPPTAAVVGDSFGDAFLPGVEAAAEAAGVGVYVMTRAGCRPLLGARSSSTCEAHARAVSQAISADPKVQRVLLIGRWSTMVEGERFGVGSGEGKRSVLLDQESTTSGYQENQRVFERRIAATVNGFGAGKQVSIAAYVPEQRMSAPATLTARKRLGMDLPTGVSREDFEQRHRRVRQSLTTVAQSVDFRVIDVGAAMCSDTTCPVTDGRVSLYVDDNHLSATGARLLRQLLVPALAP